MRFIAATLFLVYAGIANGASISFTNKAQFLDATTSTSLEDFNSLADGLSFDGIVLDIGDFSLLRTPEIAEPNRNQIDAPPPQFSEFNIDGTTVANVLTTSGSSLFVTFETGVTAFGVDLGNLNDDAVRTEIVINGVSTIPDVQGDFDPRFFGFISSDEFTTVEFRGIINDGFSMDNVLYGQGNVVPIPAAVWLFGSALAGLGWLRRQQTT